MSDPHPTRPSAVAAARRGVGPHGARRGVGPRSARPTGDAPADVASTRAARPPAWRPTWTLAAALVGAAVLTLAGCANPAGIGPTHTLRERAPASTDTAATDPTPWPADRWWQAYGDARLDALITRALADQPALRAVQARLAQAGAAAAFAGADERLRVDASASLIDQRYPEHGLIPPPLAGAVAWSADARVGASWELDLFGRQRAALDAAIGQLRAAQAEARAAEVLLAGQVAAGYVELARRVEARGVADAALTQRQQVLALVRQRIGAGLDTTVELRQAEGLVAQSTLDLALLDEALDQARHALAELTGQTPQALDGLSPALASLRAAPLPATLPADLLGRRADLVAQRWRVEAALRTVDVARAQFYPDVNLSAFVGLSSLGLGNFAQAGSLTYGAGPALRLPLFDAGRLRAQLGLRAAEADVAIEAYNAALLRALREVADDLGTLRAVERQQQAQTAAADASEAALTLAVERYRAGLGNFLTVLGAEGQVLAQRRSRTDLTARHLAAEMALNRSLGGGYRAEALPAPAVATSPLNVASPATVATAGPALR